MKFGTLGLLVVLLAAVSPVGAQPEQAGQEVFAIQKKIFHRFHEVGLDLGYIADDDFYHLFPAGAYYNYHFNDELAWQVIRGHWMLDAEKDLRNNLVADFGVAPTAFSRAEYALHSNLVWKPFYGKDAFRNRKVINHETYFFAGLGGVSYERRFSRGDTAMDWAPSISLGVGKTLFLTPSLRLHLEIRDWINFRDDGIDNNLWFGLSFGLGFNLSARRTAGDVELNDLNRFLKEDQRVE